MFNQLASFTTYISECFKQEFRQLFLWVPVCLATGIGIYFILPIEPTWYLLGLITSNCILLSLLLKKKYTLLALVICALSLVSLGVTLASIRSKIVLAPVIEKSKIYDLHGIITDIDTNHQGIARYIINVHTLAPLLPSETPEYVRVTIRTKTNNAQIGNHIFIQTKLSPPPRPVMPGAYDFARKSYFQRIGAVGFAISDVDITSKEQHSSNSITAPIMRFRERIATHNNLTIGEKSGSIASALMVGKRFGIDDETMNHIRNAGIAHLLAISGLHLVIVTGFSFWATRFLLSRFTYIAEYYDIKKIAASCAILTGGIYLLMTGVPISALRAYVMTSLFLTAILLDREPTPMNSVALAATFILITKPESLLTPGFQMSFAAVIALIASFDLLNRDTNHGLYETSSARRFIRYIGNIIFSSLVAAIATAPFGMYHFNNYSMYGVITNLIAIPLTTLWIMPLAMISMILYPLKLSFLTLIPMGYGIDLLLSIAKQIASLPYAYRVVPSFSPIILSITIFSGLWLCLWKTKIRFAAIPAIIIGGTLIHITSHHDVPNIIISGDASKGYALLDSQGNLMFSEKGRNNYERDTWIRRTGMNEHEQISTTSTSIDQYHCDNLSCIYNVNGTSISFSTDPASFVEDCQNTDIIVNLTFTNAYKAFPSECANKQIISRYHLWKEGTHTIKIKKDGRAIIKTVYEQSLKRPWG